MSYQTDMAAGHADAQKTLGGIAALWLTKTVPIVIGDNSLMLSLIEGGFLEGFSFGFTCNATAAPPTRQSGQQLTVASVKYRVLKIMENPGSPLINVFCGQVNQ